MGAGRARSRRRARHAAPGPAGDCPDARSSRWSRPLTLWRAPIDNETFGPGHAGRWEQLGLRDGAAREFDCEHHGPTVTATGWSVTHDGRRSRRARRHPARRRPPRARRRASHAVEWLGAGPHECYSDRRAQRARRALDHAGRRLARAATCTRRPAATAPACAGCASSMPPARRPHDRRARRPAGHRRTLSPTKSWPPPTTSKSSRDRDECFVWIDARQRGVGSGACGPDTAPAHRIGPGTYRWSYRLR